MEKRELEYFRIGDSWGGNQDWFGDPMMKLGGCGAATACDVCIYLARQSKMTALYPFDETNLNRKDYVKFAMKMKPYLRPRMGGIRTLEVYLEGFGAYLKDRGETGLRMAGFSGENSFAQARIAVQRQIDRRMPIPYLLLHHVEKELKDFEWHWFLLTGYECDGEKMSVKAVTYGTETWLDLETLWNTGYEEKGGMILLEER